MQKPKLILGSSSPRRRGLLDQVGLSYTVMRPEVAEVLQAGELPVAYVLRLATEKAQWVYQQAQESAALPAGMIVIAADTTVALDKLILEKPHDRADAKRMLRMLSGATHTVHTGVCLIGTPPGSDMKSVAFSVATKVTLKNLSEAEIAAYVQTGEPLDKAGAYGAQGIGSYMVKRIEGSYANVVGLPVAELVERLADDFQYSLWN